MKNVAERRGQARLRDQMQIVVGLGIADRDRVALAGQPRERRPEIATAYGRKRDLHAANARGGENVDQIGIRIAVVAPPDLGLLERTAVDQDAAVDGGAAGGRKGGRENAERRTRP